MRTQEIANEFLDYARNYNVRFVDAARDRDWPMDEQALSEVFYIVFKRKPTKKELADMSPDRNAADLIQEEIADYRSIYE